MKKIFFLGYLFLFIVAAFDAQTAKQEKQLAKVNSLLKKNKVEKAEKKLIHLLEEKPEYGDAWDLMSNIKFYYYQKTTSTPDLFKGVSLTVTDKDGNEIEPDSSAQLLLHLLQQVNPTQKARTKYLQSLRMATAHSPTAFSSSMKLRAMLRDNYSDTTLQEKEIELFKKAEKEFQAKNYNEAALYYQQALDENPDYYKALLYLADSYYMTKNYVEAIKKFKVCVQQFPEELEPRKYLVDSYLGESLYQNAFDAAIASKSVYPDLILNYRLLQAADRLDKRSVVWHLNRDVLPNKVKSDSLIVIENLENLPEIEVRNYWNDYKKAEDIITPFCSASGLITKKTELTNSDYMEVFSWEKMLSENNDVGELETAKEMQRLGYLDCYALITCFHDDFYEQYKHFVQNNQEKITRYYNEIVFKPKSM